jgi:hypothetical protein
MDVAEHDSQALKAPGGLPSIMQAVAEGGGGRLVEVLVAAGADPDAGAGEAHNQVKLFRYGAWQAALADKLSA